jgi:hypothetical protein
MISTGDLVYSSYRQASLYTYVSDVLNTYVGAIKASTVLALLFSVYEQEQINFIHALVNV